MVSTSLGGGCNVKEGAQDIAVGREGGDVKVDGGHCCEEETVIQGGTVDLMQERDWCDLRGGCDVTDPSYHINIRFGPRLEKSFTDWTSVNFNSVPHYSTRSYYTACNTICEWRRESYD